MNISLPCFCQGVRQLSREKPERDTLQGGSDGGSDAGAPESKSTPAPGPQEASQMPLVSVIRN